MMQNIDMNEISIQSNRAADDLDDIDRRLLDLLQADAARTNQALAEARSEGVV